MMGKKERLIFNASIKVIRKGITECVEKKNLKNSEMEMAMKTQKTLLFMRVASVTSNQRIKMQRA